MKTRLKFLIRRIILLEKARSQATEKDESPKEQAQNGKHVN